MSRGFDRLVTLVLVLVVLVMTYCVSDSYWIYTRTVDKELLRYKPGTPGYNAAASPITDDMAAWLTLDGTTIDYPVMQARDNVTYLNTDPYGRYSLSGSIFLDHRCDKDFGDEYSLVYGHHMEYGKMFGALDDFLDEGYMKAHQTGELILGKDAHGIYGLRVFASMRVSAKDERIFQVPQENAGDYITARAQVCLGQPQGRIVALSTCAEGEQVSRIVVFCYIVDAG